MIIFNDDVLRAIDDYHEKSLAMQHYHHERNRFNWSEEEFRQKVNDDLIYHVPIYDMLDRRYAAFSSFVEAVKRPDEDSKGNSKFFPRVDMDASDWFTLFYLFRLCGSGINYKPKLMKDQHPKGTHGFGNFWVVDALLEGDFSWRSWLDRLRRFDGPFTNNSGYLLPQFSYKHLSNGHLKHFILTELEALIDEVSSYLYRTRGCEIFQLVDHMNDWLKKRGYTRQNFVLSAFAMDVAEYYPEYVGPQTRTYAGSNAKRCIRAIFKKGKGVNDFDFENDCMRFLADRYRATPYSVEDSRLCDVVRYFQEYQSEHHVAKNNGIKHKNNSILKQLWGEEKYYTFANNLK